MKNAFGMDDSENNRNTVISQSDQETADKSVDKTKNKERVRSFWNRIKRFYHRPVVKAIRGSALFSLLKALVLVFLLLLLLFSIHPKEAFIRAELQKKDDDRIWIQAKELKLQGINADLYVMTLPNGGISIDLDGISINDSAYSDGDKLIVSSKYTDRPVMISFHGNTELAILYNATTNLNNVNDFYAQSSYCRFVGEITLEIQFSDVEIVKKDGTRESLNNVRSIKLIDTLTKEIIEDCKKNISLSIDEAGNIIPSYENSYLNYTHLLEQYTTYHSYGLRFYLIDESPKDESYLSIYVPRYDSISSDSVIECKLVAFGDMYFSYKPAPEKYDIRSQELKLAAPKSELSLLLDRSDTSSTENPVIISGYVREAQLSNMNLFPDFWVWYNSNLYLVPLTLISTVLAAAAMFISAKKESDESNQKKEPSIKQAQD